MHGFAEATRTLSAHSWQGRGGRRDGDGSDAARLGHGVSPCPEHDELLKVFPVPVVPEQSPAAEFESFFTTTAPAVRRYAYRMVDASSVDDIVSETFTLVWQRWSDVPVEEAPRRAWTFRVAHHRVQHWYEAKQREVRLHRRLAPVRTQVADHADELADEAGVAALLAVLPPAEREAMWLVVCDGLTPQDAAYVLDCSASALTSRLSRARQRLAVVLAERATQEVTR